MCEHENINKLIIWFYKELWYNQSNTMHNKTIYILHGIYNHCHCHDETSCYTGPFYNGPICMLSVMYSPQTPRICEMLEEFKVGPVFMMMSSNGNIFPVTRHLCREFTGHRWIPHTMASDTGLWCINGWVYSSEAGDLRCYRTHCDVTVMCKSMKNGSHFNVKLVCLAIGIPIIKIRLSYDLLFFIMEISILVK